MRDHTFFDHDDVQQKQFYQLIEQLLSVPGESGCEEEIRSLVVEKLTPYVDHVNVDSYGNVLAQKTYGSGLGPTVLLNAHLDTVYGLEPDRMIMKNGDIWHSSEGILGADDRAGVAVVLETARMLADSSFTGKVKYIFTVEEECGLVGARNVHPSFLRGIDAAIVADRRGHGDIVTSRAGIEPFCHPAYGQLFERIAKKEGLLGWKCTNGGSSDTRVWASHGIQSVNLSVGYRHEHSEREELDVAACYNTTKLIAGFFKHQQALHSTLHTIQQMKKASGYDMKQVEEALQKRGFLIWGTEKGLYLSKGSHAYDKQDLSHMLKELSISFSWDERYLQVGTVNEEQLHSLQTSRAHNHEACLSPNLAHWKYFIQRKHGLKIQTTVLEHGIAALVKAMSAVGLITYMSCDGHGNRQPFVEFAGVPSAVWFEMLQEKYLQRIQLHYRWTVSYQNELTYQTRKLTAATHDGRKRFNLDKIQEDSFLMAKTLLAHADEIRELKQQLFKKGSVKGYDRMMRNMSVEEIRSVMYDMAGSNVL